MTNSQNINVASVTNFDHLFGQQKTNAANAINNSQFLLLNMADLSGGLLNQLKAAQCKMLILNENFKIIEDSCNAGQLAIQIIIEGKKQQVAVENIIRLEANVNYTYIYLNNKANPVLTSRTLKYYARILQATGFIRLHNKHLVNVAYIKQFKQSNTIELTDDTLLPVSRRRLKQVKQLLAKPLF